MVRPGDDRLHYSDGSHRWIAPDGVQQEAWDAGMRAHLFLHLATMGGSVTGPVGPQPPWQRRSRRGANGKVR